jgi:hypothetical protein
MHPIKVHRRPLLTLAILTSTVISSASAAEYTVAVGGTMSSVSDENNWFNNSLHVGQPVTGSYNFFDTGYQRQDDPESSFYRYHISPNGFSFPVLPAKLHLDTGGHAYETAPSFFFYGIRVINNNTGPFDPAGDGYLVQSPLPFPSHFNDLAGDPELDPDFNFFPILGMTLRLTDSTGTVYTDTDLPLTAPDLSRFTSATGTIFIADGNGEPNYAEATFQITSLRLVPEPTTLAIAIAAGLRCAARTRRVS